MGRSNLGYYPRVLMCRGSKFSVITRASSFHNFTSSNNSLISFVVSDQKTIGFLDNYEMVAIPNILLLILNLVWNIWFSTFGHDKGVDHTPTIVINHLCPLLFGPDKLP